MPISRAFTTRVESCFESIAQPTILRLHASKTAWQKTFPSLAWRPSRGMFCDVGDREFIDP